MRIVFGLLLIIIAFVWGAFWTAGASMTTETGIWNSGTWAIMGVAAVAIIPLVAGFYLLGRGFANLIAGTSKRAGHE